MTKGSLPIKVKFSDKLIRFGQLRSPNTMDDCIKALLTMAIDLTFKIAARSIINPQVCPGFLLGPGHRDLYSAILIFVPAIFTLSLY